MFGSNQAFIDIEYNGANPDKAFTFKALDKFGVYKDCPITEVKQKAGTRSFPVKNYVFTLTLPDTERESIPLQIFFHGEKRTEIEIPVITPKYSVEADAFAKYVAPRLSPRTLRSLESSSIRSRWRCRLRVRHAMAASPSYAMPTTVSLR